MATVNFSSTPGRHERHFMRKIRNPLFSSPIESYTNEELMEVQRLDHEELLEYVTELRAMVKRAVDLKENEESQVILDLKADLDKAYEKASTLADNQDENSEVIRHLITVIMRTVRASAANDPEALHNLDEEDEARSAHFLLLENPIVADLLDPESPIAEDELVPTLLSETRKGLDAALQLFDQEQLQQLFTQASELIGHMEKPHQGSKDRLQQIKQAITLQ